MLVAKATNNTEHTLDQQRGRRNGSSKNGILRRNTFSSGTRPYWKRKGAKDEEREGERRRLSCVLETEVITNYQSNSSHHNSCSQVSGNITDKKDSCVENIDRYKRTTTNTTTTVDPSLSSSKEHTLSVQDMAWSLPNSSRSSPSHYRYSTTAVSSNNNTTTEHTSPSWLETISNKFTSATTTTGDKNNSKRKKTNGLFGSLRGKSVTRAEKRRQSATGLDTTIIGGPRSPLLVGHHKTNSDHPSTSPITKQQLYIRPKLEAKGSTGFQTIDGGTRHNDASLHRFSSRNEYGSCHELSGELLTPSEDTMATTIRKSSSLPRTLLCSPVLSRKGRGSQYNAQQRPTSQWLYSDLFPEDSPSPPSSLSRHGSSDTIQGVEPTTPTEMAGSDWKLSSRNELVSKTSLTRSSSLPFEKFDLVEKKPISERGVPVGVASLVGTVSGRLTMRSQSFNTHFSTSHANVSQSQESVVVREHIVRFLLETEHSYILSLRTLNKDYHSILTHIDCSSLQKIFKIVPQLAVWHDKFAAAINRRLKEWSEGQTIGDILIENFSQELFMRMYSEYVQHYSLARTTLETAKQNKASLTKTLEELSRENRGKLSVEDLLIKPVQRIPRYLLFVKDLIRQTHRNHNDYDTLQESHYQLSKMADHVNESERIFSLLQIHKELLTTVEGLAEALSETSSLKRCDNVTEIRGSAQKKDRLIMLYNDRVVCASTRRRSAGFRKGSLMNVNSLISDVMKYQIKWTAELTSISVNQFHAPIIERRRYNTIEKTLHNMQEDETLLLQMINNSNSLHTSHQELTVALNELLSSIRADMSGKRQEMDNLQLPHETSRMDLTLQNCSPPSKLSLVFSSQKERQEWEKAFKALKTSSPVSPTKRHHTPSSLNNEGRSDSNKVPKFLWHVGLPPCRVGSELSSIAVPSNSTNQYFVCINDMSGRGNVAILSARTNSGCGHNSKDTPPQLVATLPLSSSRLLCSLCVEHQSTDNQLQSLVAKPHPQDTSTRLRSITTAHASSYIATPINHEDERRNLAPPIPEGNQWLWLGTEGGILHILKVGVASLHVSSSLSVQIGSAILCLLADRSYVWAGLNNGRIALFNLSQEINHPEHFISLSSSCPIKSIATMKDTKLVATGNRIMGVSLDFVYKELINFSEYIDHMIVKDEWAFVSIKKSMTIHICSCNGVAMETISTIDCTSTITSSLKYYDPIIKQHKCTHPFITGLTANKSLLFIGTSTGVLVTMPLPLSSKPHPQHSLKPHPLYSLTRGHVDSVSTLFSLQLDEHQTYLISGGHGLEELSKARASDSVSETEGCLLFWCLLNKECSSKSMVT